jgi:transcriptional regulator with XRE-family HTH domain
VPTLEGALVAEWREAQGLTQEQLGERFTEAVGRTRIKNIETGPNSLTVSSLLRIIRGLDVPGRNDRERLARFFQGPAAAWSEMVAERAETAYGAIRELRKELAPRPKRKRAR